MQIVIGMLGNNNVLISLNVRPTFSMIPSANNFHKPALILPLCATTKVHLAVQDSVERNAKLI